MEMEINVINNDFHRTLFKNKSKRKRKFIINQFLVENKPHERIDLLITTSMNIYQRKRRKKSISIVMKTCFSEEKLIKQFRPSTF